MSDTKMLQIVLDKVSSVDKNVISLEKKVDKGFKEVNGRLDKIGSSVAFLENDTPTIVAHENLEKRMTKVEKQVASN